MGNKSAETNRLLSGYHNKPEQTAWIVLVIAFGIFCLLLVSIPLGVRSYVYNARTPQTTVVTSINGTVLAKPSGAAPLAVLRGNQAEIDASTIISTDADSQAALIFFDESTITMYGDTTLFLHQATQPRFRLSPESDIIEVEIVKGRIRAALSDSRPDRSFTITVPQGQILLLAQGSYAVEVDNNEVQVTVRDGLAEVSAQGQNVRITDGQLSTIDYGQPPSAATEAEQDLIVNGDFREGLSDSWRTEVFVPPNSTDVVSATVQVERIDDSSALIFSSDGEDNIHTDAAIEQILDKDVRDFQSLRITADILLEHQSLPGGGWQGTEYPVMIKLSYKDAEGNDRDWYHGFYFAPPPGNYILYNEADNGSENISQGFWYPYESENLLETLADFKPVYIKSIRIYASGWIYRAMVTNVQLLVKD
jgi:hypothetical protein